MFKTRLLPIILLLSALSIGALNTAQSQITYYWIGGTGNWTDVNHWSLTSGGAAGTVLPGTLDNVVFDNASGVAGYTVTGTTMDTVATLNALNAQTFTLDVNLTVTNGFTGPSTLANFGSAGKSLVINNLALSFSFKPGTFFFLSDIKVKSSIGSVSFDQTLSSCDSLILINGNVSFLAGIDVYANYVCSVKPSGIDTRNFSFNNAKFYVEKNSWKFSQYAVANDRPSRVEFTLANTNGLFQDSVNITSMPYDTLIVPTCAQLLIPKRIGIKYLSTQSDTIRLGAAEGLGFATLISSGLSCSNFLYIKSTSTTLSAPFNYLGAGTTCTLNFTNFNRIAAQNTPIITYTGTNSLQTNSTGFNLGNPKTFYWIGNGGNWSDPTHWSSTSGGVQSCAFPKYNDTIIFDGNSFNMTNQIVHLDTGFVVGKMLWTNIPTNLGTQFLLEDSLDMTGNFTMDADVFVNCNIDTSLAVNPLIQFKKSSLVNLNSCAFNATIVLKTPQTDTVQLVHDYVSSDSSAIFLHSGSLKTNNYKIHTQAINSFEGTQKKNLFLGSSLIELVDGWNTDTLDYYLNVFAGTSTIKVGHYKASNYFIVKNQVFNNVVFNFHPADTGLVKYNNTMKSLTIKGGSTIEFKAGNQYTLDTLIIDGGCDKLVLDTVWSINYSLTTLLDSTILDTVIINGSTTNSADILYGNYILSSPLTYYDTTYEIGHTLSTQGLDSIYLNDTVVSIHLRIRTVYGNNQTFTTTDSVYNYLPVYDTVVVGPVTTYYYADTIIRWVRYYEFRRDSIGVTPIVSYSVDTTANGNQAVNLFTSTGGSAFTFNTPKTQKIYGVKMKDIHITGNTGTVFFGTNVSNNTGWTFNAALSTVANFTTDNAYCFGDTVHFTNTSTAFSGNINDLIYVWDYDETQHLGDTNAYVFHQADTHFVSLTTYYTNSCSSKKIDTIFINKPRVTLNMSEADSIICTGTVVEFTASSPDTLTQFQFYINGISQGLYSLVDSIIVPTINDLDTISVSASKGGCYSVDKPRIIFDVKPLPTVTISSSDPNDTICIGTTLVFHGSGANTYKFFKNSTAVTSYSSIDSLTAPGLVDNDTIWVVGVESAFGCRDTSAFRIIDVEPFPVISLSSSTTTICQNDPVTFTASGAQYYNFLVNGIPAQSGLSSTYLTDSLASGNVVSVNGLSAYGCSDTSATTISMIVNNIPITTLTYQGTNVICAGTPVTFFANGAGLYEFFKNGVSLGAPSGTNQLTITNLVNNDYIHVNGSFSGCSDLSDTVHFTVNALPSTALTSNDADNIICQNTSVTFTGSGATNYQFFVNGSAVTSNSTNATYTTSTLTNGAIVKVVGESNGCFVSSQLTLTVNGIPNVNALSSDADNTLCFGDPLTITGSGANSSYQISIDGSLSAAQASPIFNPALTVGTHTVFLVGNATNGCSSNSNNSYIITVNPIPSMTLTSNDADNIICAGQSVTFTGSGSTLYQFYINGSSQTSNSTTNTFTTTALTNGQTVTVRGTSLGCVGNSTGLTFTVNPIPSMSITSTDADNIFCQGTSVVYTATGPSSYQFFVDGVSQGAASATNTFNASGVGLGNHVISITGTSLGCSTTSTQNITVNGNPTVSMTASDADNIICAGQSVTFTGTGATNYQFFQNGIAVGASTINANYVTTSISNGNSYYVVGSTTAGCTATSSTFTFTVNPNPVMSLTSTDADNIICSGDAVTFTGTSASTYEFFINGTSQGAASPTNTFTTTGLANNSSITVKGTTAGCSTTSAALVFNVNQIPVVSVTASNGTSLCSSQQAQVQAGGANTYQLLLNGVPQGAFTTNSIFNQTVANNDVITIVGQLNGCLSTSATGVTYSVTSNPTLSVVCSDADFTICKNDAITFTGSGATTYSYTLNGIPVQSGTNGVYLNGTLDQGDVVLVTGYNSNCASTPQSFTFNVNSMNLSLNAVPNELVCAGSSLQFAAGGGDLYEFFVNGNSQGSATATNTITLPSVQPNDYVSFTATNSTTGCIQQLGYEYYPTVVPGVQIAALSATSFCQGDSVTLLSNFSYGNQWYLDGTPIVGATDTFYVATQAGIYTVEHTAGGSGEIWSKGYNGSGTIGNSANIDSPTPLLATGISGITQISAGYDFAIALDNSGKVFAWGENGSGQLGNGTFTTTNQPAQIATLSAIQQIATTSSSCAALTSTGTVYVWGNNNYGQLGIGSFAIINFPFQIPALTNVAEIVGGQDHFVIRKTDGTVWTVGKNTFGQLGHGNLTNTTTFSQVAGLSGIVKIGSGENHSFAINANGDLYLWGNNINGQLGLGDNTNKLVPVLSNMKHVIEADGGAVHTLVLTSNSEVFAMGDNSFGQLGNPMIVTQTNYPVQTSNLSGVKAISCGEYSSLALLHDKRVFGTGYNAENQLMPTIGNVMAFAPITQVDGVTAIEAGKRTTHYLFGNAGACTSGGTSVTVFVPTQPTITQAGAVLTSSAAVSYQWHLNNQAIPSGTQQNYTAIATGDYFVTVTDANGCTANSDTVYYFVLGLNELKNLSVQCYPNPTSGVINFTFSETIETGELEIVDMTGRLIQTRSLNNSTSEAIDLSSEANGSYIIRMKYLDHVSTVSRIILAK